MVNGINKKRNKKGFTLIELVVVIAILGILSAIAIPRLAGFRGEAALKADSATMKTIQNAIATAAINNEINLPTAGTATITITSGAVVDGSTTATSNPTTVTIPTVVQKYLGTPLPIPQENGKLTFLATIDGQGGVVVTKP